MKQAQKVQIKEYSMLCSMSLEKEHRAKHWGVFVCEGLPLHGKKFYHESYTKVIRFMEFGKTKSLFYLDEPNSKAFKSMAELIKFYHP
jgi:hypothetical protein